MQTALAATVSRRPANGAALRGTPLARPVPATPAMGVTRRLGKDQELFAEGEHAGAFYKVVTGALRTYRLLEDGRRQIDAFHLPGDILGIEAGKEHRFTAEAIGESTVLVYRRCSLEAAAAGEGDFARELVAALMRSLERARDHMLLLGCKSALEKIATFILDMSRRDHAEEVVALPMSRLDIADHLGLTIETVSRSLSALERRGTIEVSAQRRTIVIRDRAALRRCSGGTGDVM